MGQAINAQILGAADDGDVRGEAQKFLWNKFKREKDVRKRGKNFLGEKFGLGEGEGEGATRAGGSAGDWGCGEGKRMGKSRFLSVGKKKMCGEGELGRSLRECRVKEIKRNLIERFL